MGRKCHREKNFQTLFMDVFSFWSLRDSLTVKCEVRKHAASVKLVYHYSSLQIKAEIHCVVSIMYCKDFTADVSPRD